MTSATPLAVRAGSLVGRGWRAIRSVLLPWAVARVIVGGALALAHLILTRTHPSSLGVAARVHEGLLGWDAGIYEGIARFGYAAIGRSYVRFFPLFPLTGRAAAVLPGVSAGTALVVISNLASLVGTALVWALVQREKKDRHLARRTVWLLSLAPPAFVMVMGYAEGLFLVFTAACFLFLRPAPGGRPLWWWAALFGFAAALTRPVGVLVALVVAIEGIRWWKISRPSEKVATTVAVLAPVAGLITFLGWSAAAFGDFWLPISEQTSSAHHGGLADPFRTLIDDAKGAFHHHFGTALHVPWVFLVLVLVVVCWRRLPASYGAFSTGIVALALSGTNLDSFERYALSAFPLVISGALLTASSRVERTVLCISAAGLAGYALLAFLNLSVP